MDDLLLVQLIEGRGQLFRQQQRFRQRQAMLRRIDEALAQSLSMQIFHDDVRHSVRGLADG